MGEVIDIRKPAEKKLIRDIERIELLEIHNGYLREDISDMRYTLEQNLIEIEGIKRRNGWM